MAAKKITGSGILETVTLKTGGQKFVIVNSASDATMAQLMELTKNKDKELKRVDFILTPHEPKLPMENNK